jgi:hypothetical protein
MPPTQPGFYITGGTVPQGAPSYVERQADRDLFAALQRGEYCYVLTSRQMGKSSLMVHTATRLREAGAATVVLDLTAMGQNLSAEQWFGGLLLEMGQQLDPTQQLEDELDKFWFIRDRLGPLRRWVTALREIVLPRLVDGSLLRDDGSDSVDHQPSTINHQPPRLVIFVDEIDAVRTLPFSTDEFFAGVRECYNRRTQDSAFHQLAFCLLGVTTPSDLIQDTRTSLSTSAPASS